MSLHALATDTAIAEAKFDLSVTGGIWWEVFLCDVTTCYSSSSFPVYLTKE